jgi:hypothetical protein
MDTTRFDPNKYGPVVASLITGRLMELGPGSPNQAVYAKLKSLEVADLFDEGVHDMEMAKACLSGLWLYHDFLDESHSISQEIHSATGSYWHGIMHRREPDYSNSKYWFRRVGEHPIFSELHDQAAVLTDSFAGPAARLSAQGRWDPFAFVDLCESANRRDDDLESLCRAIQLREWELLFDFSYRQATQS